MTPMYGNTPQGTQLSSLDNVLAQITGASTPQVQGAYDASTTGALQMQGNEPAYAQQIGQQNQQQLTQPLYNQMGDLQNMFQLYLADKGLAQKYQNITGGQGQTNPYTDPALMASATSTQGQLQTGNQADLAQLGSMTTGVQPTATTAAPSPQPTTTNPYLASPDAIIASAASAPQAPSVTTAEMQQPIVGGMDMLGLLTSLINTEKGVASNATAQEVAQYEGKTNLLSSLSNLLSGELTQRNALSQPGSANSVQASFNSVQADAKKGMTLKDLMQKYTIDPNMTADKIMQIYNANSPYGPAKEDPITLAQTYGVTGRFGKTTKLQLKKLPNGTMANYDSSTGKLYDTKTGKQLNAQSDQVDAATQLADAAQSMMDDYQKAGAMRYLPGSQYINPDVARAQQTMFQSLGALRKSAIGGRITQQEIGWLTSKLFPSPYDSDQVMQAKVDGLRSSLNKLVTDPNSHVSPDGTVVDTPTNNQTITIRNKKTGQTMVIKASEKGKYGL